MWDTKSEIAEMCTYLFINYKTSIQLKLNIPKEKDSEMLSLNDIKMLTCA